MKVKIGYLGYNVEEVDRMPEGKEDLGGEIDYSTQKILLLNQGNVSINYLNFIFWHEFAHGLMQQIGMGMNDESNADKFGHVLYQTFGDYKQYLYDEE